MRVLAATLAVLLGAAPLAFGGERVNVRWQGKTGTSAALPAGFPEPAHAALGACEAFCKRAGYRADADATGRLLLVTSEKGSRADEELRQLAKVSAWFDAHFPALVDPKAEKTEPVCATLFVVRNPEDYALLLAHLADTSPMLAEWIPQARKETGFVLGQPLCGAYLEDAPGMEEWSPVHELVDRAAQLFLLQRHGELPYWIQQGAAWAAEWAYDGALYSFPYRHEFVLATEHTAWPGEIKAALKARAQKPLELAEFGQLRRGSWDPERAKLAFAAASFLALQPGDKLARALSELAAFRSENNRTYKDDGSWTSDPLYEIPNEKQLELLEAALGPKLMERIGAFAAKGAEAFRGLARP